MLPENPTNGSDGQNPVEPQIQELREPPDAAETDLAAIVLAGGASRRMGRDKASLMTDTQTFLQRVVTAVASVAGSVVVVGPAGMAAPPLDWGCPAKAIWRADSEPQAGPLVGLANGLTVVKGKSSRVLLVGCDSPGIRPALLRRLAGELLAAPSTTMGLMIAEDSGRLGLISIWRTGIAARLNQLIATGERKLQNLPQRLPVGVLRQTDFAVEDPDFQSFLNINTPEDYQKWIVRQ